MQDRPSADAWIVSELPKGSSPKINALRLDYRKLPQPAALELARYIVPSGPLQWEDLAGARVKLKDFISPSRWPALSTELRNIVYECEIEDQMPREVPLDTWEKIIADYEANHPDSAPKRPPLTPSSSSSSFTPIKGTSSSSGSSYATASPSPAPATAPAATANVIVYRARMTVSGRKGHKLLETITLEAPTTDLSCRFYAQDDIHGVRHFKGSERFIRVNIPLEDQWKIRSETAQEKLNARWQHRIWVGNYAYRPFITKDNNMFLFCEQGPDLATLSLFDYVDYQIPFDLNSHMSQNKWIARFQLGLSKTVPTITFQGCEVRRVPDIYNNSLPMGSKCMLKIVDSVLAINGSDDPAYIPSAIRGKVRGMDLYWRLSHDPQLADEDTDYIYLPKQFQLATPAKIVFFIDRMDGSSLKSSVTGLGRTFYTQEEYHGPGADMTDGHGLISIGAACDVAEMLHHDSISNAIQARLLGAKGVWSPPPESVEQDSEEKWIEIRDAQLKYFTPRDRSGVFEVVKTSAPRPPVSMTHQLLQILNANGVNSEIFLRIIDRMRQENLDDLDHLDVMDDDVLRKYLFRLEPQAFEKEAKASALASSPGDVVKKRNFSSMEAEDQDLRKVSRNFMNNFSHCPTYTCQRALAMLDAGFRPTENAYFARLLLDLLQSDNSESTGKDVAIPCKYSTNLIVVPDPTGTLGPGEIYFQSSESFAAPQAVRRGMNLTERPGRTTNVLTGPCLVTRDPALLPTDVQKVQAVNNPALANFQDVIVFPTVGEEALCSLLGGGDYDGDTVKLLWDRQIVASFTNAPKEWALPPGDLEDRYITSRQGSMHEDSTSFHMRKKESRASLSCQVAQMLVSTLFTPRQFGTLANMHTTAGYELGLGHEDSRLLAYLFAISLDGGKSGKFIEPSQMAKLQRRYGKRFPRWARQVPMDPIQKLLAAELHEDCARPKDMPQHVMDILTSQFYGIGKHQREEATEKLSKCDFKPDKCLREYSQALSAEAEEDPKLASDLRKLRAHVEACIRKFESANQAIAAEISGVRSPSKKRTTFDYTSVVASVCEEVFKPIDLSSDRMTRFDGQETSRKFRASALYDSSCNGMFVTPTTPRGWRLKGPWVLCFRELANFKANRISMEQDLLRGGQSMQGSQAQAFTDAASNAAKRRRLH